MIRKYVMTCLIMLVVSASGIAFANDIYKWTDEDGNIHYGDRPTGDATEERMAISSSSTNPSKVQARLVKKSTGDCQSSAGRSSSGPPTKNCG